MAICSAENCKSQCKIRPSEDLLISKGPERRRLQFDIEASNLDNIR